MRQTRRGRRSAQEVWHAFEPHSVTWLPTIIRHPCSKGDFELSKKHQLGPLKDHDEWVEHIYNPGYWINRVTSRDIALWRRARRYAILNGLIGMLGSGLSAFALAYPIIQQSRDSRSSFLWIMFEDFTIWEELFFIFLFALSLAMFVRGIIDRVNAKSSAELDSH